MTKNEKEFIVQKIRTQYTEKTADGLYALRKLDAMVKKAANIFAYVFGSISAVIMGCGMSLVMTDIGSAVGISDPMVPGIVIGVIGMIMAILNYPLYKSILDSRKRKYAPDIIALSDKIMKD